MRTINYLLLAVAISIFVGLFIMKRHKLIQKKWQRRTVHIVGWLVALSLILAVVFFPSYPPVPVTGPYPYQVQTIQFAQPNRKDPYRPEQNRTLVMDYYYPISDQLARHSVPLIIFSHGGISTKTSNVSLFTELASHGYAVASIQYRLSRETLFPAQIQDCKEAVRWLRAHANEYGLDGARIGAWGSSAGGHLVAMLGTSGGVAGLEGNTAYPQISARVQAVCDWFGPTDFLQMNDHPGSMDHNAADSPESQLVGGPIQEHPDRVAAANPITYISGDEPPFLIMHGDSDMLVPHHQSVLLYRALKKAGVEVTLRTLPGVGHDGPEFRAPEIIDEVIAFFGRHLRPA